MNQNLNDPRAESATDDDAMASTGAEMKKGPQVMDVPDVFSPLEEIGPDAKQGPLSDERRADDPPA